ncbi:MAG TPA: hypothetical protein VN796_01930 [Acidimicrobiales bacterium]|nr:hypothetical protein [Acidimicrobiales bacterium]
MHDLFGGFDGERHLGGILEEVPRIGARLLLQIAFEAEVTEFLRRDRFERRSGAETAREGSRNGHGELRVRPPPGPVVLVHLALDGPELRRMEPDGWQVRHTDYGFLLSADARETIEREGMVLPSYEPLREVWAANRRLA